MHNLFKFFHTIKTLIGRRIYMLLILISVVGFVEGISVTLFFPIMQSGFGDDKLSRILAFIFGSLGLAYSFSLMLILIAVFFILRSAFLVLYMRYFAALSSRLLVDLRRRILARIFAADYLYLLRREIGYMSNALNREISRVVDAFDTFAYVFNYTAFALIYLTLSFLVNMQLTVIVLIISPFLAVIMRKVNRVAGEASRNLSSSYGAYQSIVYQALSKLKYLKSTLTSGRISGIVDSENKKIGFHNYRLVFFHSLTRYIFEPIFVLIILGFLFYHVKIMKGNVNGVIFLSFLLFQISRQFINVQSSYRRFVASIGSIETLGRFEKELEEHHEDLRENCRPPDLDKDIVIDQATVVYPNGKKSLDRISVRIKPRSVVALVGQSGSGKSTVANLITGIIKPARGSVFIGDVDYRDINLKGLREKIGYITQEDVIFNASVGENISLWDEHIDMKQLQKVIEMAHITGFVNDLPERKNSMLGDNGLDISGGQRQMITIARELYKDTKLLILDEATSSLDSKSEKQIYENLKKYKGHKTMVVIAHRLSTVKNADYIYVLEDGRIVEEGTYDRLYGQKGEFTRMIEEQKLT